MSVTLMARVFWTNMRVMKYNNKQGKEIGVDNKSSKLTLLAIADNADDFGENSWQSFDTLAKKTGLDRRSVIRVIHALIKNDYCKLSGITRYGTNDYAINLSKLGFPPEKRAKTGRPKSGDSGAESGDSGAESGDSESPESSINHPKPHIAKEKIQKITDEANKEVDAILEQERLANQHKSKSWRLRENFQFNEHALALADKCASRFGEPSKKDITLWVMEIGAWVDAGARAEDWQRAEEIVSGYSQPVISITGMTKAVKFAAQERKNGTTPQKEQEPYHPEYEKFKFDPEQEAKYVPAPLRKKS